MQSDDFIILILTRLGLALNLRPKSHRDQSVHAYWMPFAESGKLVRELSGIVRVYPSVGAAQFCN